MFSNYIYKKSKTFISLEEFEKLNKLINRLKKRKLDICWLYWYLDSNITCKKNKWERVYQIFKDNCKLFPIRIRTCPK